MYCAVPVPYPPHGRSWKLPKRKNEAYQEIQEGWGSNQKTFVGGNEYFLEQQVHNTYLSHHNIKKICTFQSALR